MADLELSSPAFDDGQRIPEKYGYTVDNVNPPLSITGVPESAESLVAEYDPIQRFAFEYGLDLADRPVAETLLSGTVRGLKGRVLVLDNGGSTYAVDLRDLVGHEMTEGDPGREIQSSLGAF